jgi:hypothetical protein
MVLSVLMVIMEEGMKPKILFPPRGYEIWQIVGGVLVIMDVGLIVVMALMGIWI